MQKPLPAELPSASGYGTGLPSVNSSAPKAMPASNMSIVPQSQATPAGHWGCTGCKNPDKWVPEGYETCDDCRLRHFNNKAFRQQTGRCLRCNAFKEDPSKNYCNKHLGPNRHYAAIRKAKKKAARSDVEKTKAQGDRDSWGGSHDNS
ncbi:hypothetical protein QBC44DRAFT_307260 [Cladorrhinum sp. PSN332]|nr:hypothetical protein QBC44DRAFT_307260 [Cladorrhinum sp. PSN332]